MKINNLKKNSRVFILHILSIILLTSCSDLPEESIWYEFQPHPAEEGENVIDMTHWLEKPAGLHGFVKMDKDDYVLENGDNIKFWGVNICSARPYSERETIDQWVDYLSKYGINAVRFHKYTQHGLEENISTRLDSAKQDRMDYFQSRLKETGIYYGWSPVYGHKLRPGDRDRLLAYDEIVNSEMNSHLAGSTIGLVNFAEDIQELHIELLTSMLEHKNPYTGLRYADDPALVFVEIQNEDNIWFSTLEKMLENCPTYKQLLTDKFTRWLREKYESQEKLEAAWGEEAFQWGREIKDTNWDLDKANICPVTSHGIYGYEFEKAAGNDEVLPLFLRDMAYYLLLEQNAFYEKASEAIRATGYEGVIIGSCWQAGAGITHYYNLYSDYITGAIDRHNYFGGGTGHRLVPGEFNNKSMISDPGSGLLNTGRQAVADRPFQISEWMSLPPNEWIAEGSPLIAIYGMGLQGWDASYSFASDFPHYTSTIHTPGVYNVNTPTQIGLYPALAAMIYRNEIEEGEIVAKRNIHLPSLREGIIGFNERVKQNWDQKVFSGGVPNDYFAIGKIVLDFTDDPEPPFIADCSQFIDTVSMSLSSNTGQLKWDYSDRGLFTLNTDYSKVLAGFAGNKPVDLENVHLRTNNLFSINILTSLDRYKDLKTTDRALLTTIARAKNTGMEFNDDKSEIINVGEAPVLLESVNLYLKFNDRMIKEINILDHTGNRTGEKINVNSKDFNFDGNKFQTFYYEIIFE